mgnify:CR=1 FL=1
MNRLTLTYRFDESYYDHSLPRDDFGWLGVEVETENFRGTSGFWVQWQDVVDLGEAIPSSPARLATPLEAQWGFNMQEGDDLIVRIAIVPHGKLGELVVRVELADQYEPTNRVRASFTTTYSALDLFKADLSRLMAEELDRAELLGRETT